MTSDLSKLLYVECQQLEKEAADIQERISKDEGRLSVLQRRLEHIRALLGDEGTQGPPNAGPLAQHNYVNGTGSSVCDIAAEVLSERNGAPMYYKDLAGEVIKRGGPLHGETPWAVSPRGWFSTRDSCAPQPRASTRSAGIIPLPAT